MKLHSIKQGKTQLELSDSDSTILTNSIGWITMGFIDEASFQAQFGISSEEATKYTYKAGLYSLSRLDVNFIKELLEYVLEDSALEWRFSTLIAYQKEDVRELLNAFLNLEE